MPSSDELKRGLKKVGFTIEKRRGKGSHCMAFFSYDNKIILVTVIPADKDIPKGTLNSIKKNICLKDNNGFMNMLSGRLTKEAYINILKREGKI